MKNIYLIPTDKPSRIYLIKYNNRLRLTSTNPEYMENFGSGTQNQHIYITSDEKFNRDEYVTDGVEVIKATPKLVDAQGLVDRRDWKKIILTTDGDLIKDGVQSIDDEFLEWFVKNPSCEEVTIRKKSVVKAIVKGIGIKSFNSGYKIIIPKSELASKLKQILDNMSQGEFDEEWKKITDLKLEGPSIIIPKEEPKTYTVDDYFNDEFPKEKTNKETLEEASLKVAHMLGKRDTFEIIKDVFVYGAKWQQEQDKNKYSGQEVFNLLMELSSVDKNSSSGTPHSIAKWFEQFKK